MSGIRCTTVLFMLLTVVGGATNTLTIPAALAAAPRKGVPASIYIHGLTRPSAQEWQGILESPYVQYLLVAQGVGKQQDVVIEHARQARQAGKKIVLQIWWGPEGKTNWAKYSFAHLAYDPELRALFGRDVIDATIESIGAENIYGVHLLEETGMQFGIDVAGHTDPDNLEDDDGFLKVREPKTGELIDQNSYSQPFYTNYGKWPGGPRIPNLRRYRKQFLKQSGVDIDAHENWSDLEQYIFSRWCATDIQAEGQRQALLYLQAKYP